MEGTAEKCDAVHRAFWTFKCTCGKTWGLKPRVVYCIYTVVIRPVPIYGYMVWLLRVTYNVRGKEVTKLQRSARLSIPWAMKMTSTVAVEVLQRRPPLHVISEVQAQAGIYKLICTQRWTPKSTTFGHMKNSLEIKHEPILQWGLTGCYQDMYISHSWSRSLTSVNGRKGSTQTTKRDWSGIWTGTRSIKVLVLGCTDGAQEAGTASVLGSTPWYSRLQYIPLRLVQWRM